MHRYLDVDPEFSAIESLIQAGQLDEAARRCQRLVNDWIHGPRAANVIGVAASMRQDHDEAAYWFEKACDGSPQTAKFQRNLALAYLELGEMEDAQEHFRLALKLEGAEHVDATVHHNILLNGEQNRNGPPYVQRLKDITIETASWTILDGSNIYSRDVADVNLNNGRYVTAIDRWKQLVVMAVPPPTVEISEPCVFLGGDDNYSHWLTRIVPRLAILDEHPELKQLPLLVRSNLREYELDSLSRLGYGREQLIEVDRPAAVSAKDIYVPSFPRHNIENMAKTLSWFRERMLSNQPEGLSQESTRLFVSRKDAVRRRLINEDEIVEALAPLGVVPIVPSELTFSEQVDLFSRAELVVGAHGAGLTNVAFCPAGCGVIEITCEQMATAEDFRAIAEIFGLRMLVLMAQERDSEQLNDFGRPVYSELLIKPNSVAQAAEKILSGESLELVPFNRRNVSH